MGSCARERLSRDWPCCQSSRFTPDSNKCFLTTNRRGGARCRLPKVRLSSHGPIPTFVSTSADMANYIWLKPTTSVRIAFVDEWKLGERLRHRVSMRLSDHRSIHGNSFLASPAGRLSLTESTRSALGHELCSGFSYS